MQVTNIQEEPQKENLAVSFAKWFAVWLTVYVVVGAFGGVFRPVPQDIPAGMTWQNTEQASSSTFYILRDGPHLILGLNRHSQTLWVALFTAMAVMFAYLCGQALHGKLKNRGGNLLPPYGQKLMAVLMAAIVVFMLTYGVGNLLKKEVLDLDPAADSVRLNGDYVGPFRQVTDFRAYITRGSKGSTDYHIVLERQGGEPIRLEGGNAHGDVQQVADYLNGYLAEVRLQAPSG